MIYIDFEQYCNKNRRAYTLESEWAKEISDWLENSIGDNWRWREIGSFLHGVYVDDLSTATAFRLKFGL